MRLQQVTAEFTLRDCCRSSIRLILLRRYKLNVYIFTSASGCRDLDKNCDTARYVVALYLTYDDLRVVS